MTQIISDIRILDNLLALNLDISLWSARKKMTVEDFGGAELPPEDLAPWTIRARMSRLLKTWLLWVPSVSPIPVR